MASHDTLEFLRNRLVKDIANLLCIPCTDERKNQYTMNYEDPVACLCRCETTVPLLQRLIEVETALQISTKHLK